MDRYLTQILHHAENSNEIRVIVFSGSGDIFSARNDISDFVTVIDALREFTKPIIAAVDGFAVVIGVTLLPYCDLVYATKEAKFRTPFTHHGLCPEQPQIIYYQK